MSDFHIDKKTLDLLNSISEIIETDKDKSIFRLYKEDPDKLQEVLQSTKPSAIKDTIKNILAKRHVVNSNGQESIDYLGAKGNGYSSITEFNAEEIRDEVKKVKERADFLETELNQLQNVIEDKIVNQNREKFSVEVDVRKNLNLKAALRRVFGTKTTKITFDMYKQAIALRTRFYKEDVEATTDDEFKL